MPAATAASPWYKHLWPWIIIGILTCSVTLTLSMVTIAVKNPDNLVNDNYYEASQRHPPSGPASVRPVAQLVRR